MASYELHFLHPYRCYVVRWITDLSQDGSQAYWQALLAHPEFVPGYFVLHDLRGRRIRRDYLETVATSDFYTNQVRPKTGDRHVAILVDSAVTYGQSMQLMALLGLNDSMIVTYEEGEAKAWIGLPDDYLLPWS